MSYLYETHFHTSYSSFCGQVKPEDVIPTYVDSGYSGIVVTDHYCSSFFEGKFDDWKRGSRDYLLGYHNAKKLAAAYDFQIFLGLEIKFDDSKNDYLVFGMNEKFFIDHPYIYRIGLENFSKLCRDNGFLLIQAHPYRENVYSPANLLFIDGVEGYNEHPDHDNYNYKSLEFAQANPELVVTSGSDFHRLNHACRGGVYFNRRPRDEKDFAFLLQTAIVKYKTTI